MKDCLDSLEAQTEKPDRVLVVCSQATDEDIPESYRTYTFPLEFVTREGVYNQSQNRNEGIKRMNTDIVSFFDADDIMHPQRIEFIRRYFPGSDILLHGYKTDSPVFEPISQPIVHHSGLIRGHTGCVVFDPKGAVTRYYATGEFDASYTEWKKPLHHAQFSIRAEFLEFMKFPEDPKRIINEDALFCGLVISMSHVKSVFIEDSLSWYRLRG